MILGITLNVLQDQREKTQRMARGQRQNERQKNKTRIDFHCRHVHVLTALSAVVVAVVVVAFVANVSNNPQQKRKQPIEGAVEVQRLQFLCILSVLASI